MKVTKVMEVTEQPSLCHLRHGSHCTPERPYSDRKTSSFAQQVTNLGESSRSYARAEPSIDSPRAIECVTSPHRGRHSLNVARDGVDLDVDALALHQLGKVRDLKRVRNHVHLKACSGGYIVHRVHR